MQKLEQVHKFSLLKHPLQLQHSMQENAICRLAAVKDGVRGMPPQPPDSDYTAAHQVASAVNSK